MIHLLRRCADCNQPIGNRERFCARCGARQPRDPVRLAPAAVLIAGALVLGADAASAQPVDPTRSYPNKPVRVMVTFPAGGGVDLMARTLGQKLADAWGQQFVIDNRAGGGGVIGTEIVARAAPDGYTLLLATSSGLIVSPLLIDKLPYDPFTDFAPVSLLAINPTLLVVNSTLPVNSVKDLVAYAKSKPKQLSYASAGLGSPIHLGMEMFKLMTGADMIHVPYKGSPPAVTDLLAGQVQLMFNTMPTVLPHVKTGRLRALAVGSARRAKTVPDIPTVAESGVPGFEATTWWGMVAPAKTPASIIAKLGTQIERVLTDPEISQRMLAQGAEVQGSSPESLAKFMREESARMRKVIASAGIKAE
jgi:tripartite-type tricarboxylate transporter receptor subunit TctC